MLGDALLEAIDLARVCLFTGRRWRFAGWARGIRKLIRVRRAFAIHRLNRSRCGFRGMVRGDDGKKNIGESGAQRFEGVSEAKAVFLRIAPTPLGATLRLLSEILSAVQRIRSEFLRDVVIEVGLEKGGFIFGWSV